MSKSRDTIRAIGEEVKMPNLLERILSRGKKRTEKLDAAGVASKQAILKTEDGNEYPARCYAYVPDDEKVNTWKLRMCAVDTTEITREQLGAAAAAFSPGGHRGEKVQLPEGDVASVKKKLRDEYEKLGIERDDMPDSIKSLEEKKSMDELMAKLREATKSMHGDEMRGVLEKMEAEDADKVGLVRQLAEIVAQVEDEETRTLLDEIVKAMLEMYAESETEEEEVAEEEMAIEEEVETEEVEEKEFNLMSLVKELKLDKLSSVIAEHDEKLKGLTTLTDAMGELVNKVKALTDEVAQLKTTEEAVKEKVKELQKDDNEKLAEKQVRFTPFWASHYQASKAAETVLNDDEQKNYARPEMPSAINGMSSKIGGK